MELAGPSTLKFLSRAARVSGTLLCAGLLAACARDVEVPPYALDDGAVWVLVSPLASDEADRMTALVRDVAPEAALVPYVEWESALEQALTRRGVVAIPDTRRLPRAFHPILRDFIERGGKALFLGREPFMRPAVPGEDRAFLSQDEHHARLAETASDVPGFSTVQLWSHQNSDPSRRSVVRVARDAQMPRPGVEIEVEQLDEWDAMCLPAMPDAFAETVYNALTLYARGADGTTRLVARATLQDGSVWVRDIPVDSRWQRVVIHESDWVRADRETAYDADENRFRQADMVDLCVGLDARYAVQGPGPHAYALSDIRPVWDAHAAVASDAAGTSLLADPDARFSLDAYKVAGARSDALFHVRRKPVDALWPDPAVRFPEDAVRWAPLFTAHDRAGEASGDVAGLFIRLPPDGLARIWAWIGLDAERTTSRALRTMINECVFLLQRGRFLVGTHSAQAVFDSSDLFSVHTRVASANPMPAVARVTAELVDRDGHILRRIVTAPQELTGTNAPSLMMNVGVVPRAEQPAVDYELHVALEEVGGRSRLYDRFVQPVKVLGARDAPFRSNRLGVSGARITLGRVPVFFLGVDYNPGLFRRTDMDWLKPAFFPASLVKRDMQRLRSAGVNTLSLPYTDPAQAPQLRYVMEEADSRGMWIQLRLPTLLRRAHDTAWLEAMVEALGLADDERVFSLDIASGDGFGGEGDRALLRRAWNAWLQEQYGDIGRAVAQHGSWLELVANKDAIRFPDPEQWADWPDDAVFWPLLRRFATDFHGRRMGRAVRALRGLGCNQLITARVSVRDTDLRARAAGDPWLPLDFGTGLAHLSFVTVSADHIRGHEPDFGENAFLAAYARGWMEGRPVIWADASFSVGRRPRGADYVNQARALDEFFQLVYGTHAAGAMIRHYAPVSDRPLDADEGLVYPDRSPRPALRAVQSAANELRMHRIAPLQWAGREADPVRDARGVHRIWDNWRKVYREELAAGRVEEIRPMGYGNSSMETPARRLDGGTNGPFASMNGEWGRIEAGGEPIVRVPGKPLRVRQGEVVRLELVNTGETQWAASRDRVNGTVWVEVRHTERQAQYLEVNETAPRRRHVLEWRPRDAGLCVLRARWLGAGLFGEALHVEVLSAQEPL